ncbi:MAG: ZIP family metal transporter [Flavobacteriaceae bacterium]
MDITQLLIFTVPIVAVWAGFIFAWIVRPKSKKSVDLFLAFSGAFLLALTFFELLPEVYKEDDHKTIALFILAGILLQVFLEFFSKGAEHGHVHIGPKENKFPLLLFLSLSLHALIEGVPIHANNSILYGIIIHKIPVAIILGIFLVNSKIKKSAVLLFVTVFSVMTPLGSYFSMHSPWIADYGHLATALAIGVFFHISTIILFESSKEHSFNMGKLMVIILGVAIAYFI